MDAQATPATHEESHDSHDDHGEAILWTIAGYMMVLTFATFVTLFLGLGTMTNILFVLAIAFCKATLVVGYFMHYKYEKSWKYVLTLPACILAIITVCALMPDVGIGTWPQKGWHP